MSPWVDLNNTSSSVLQNSPFDCLDKKTLDSWATQYLGDLKLIDEYTDPLRCRSHWQDVLPESTLMIAGEFECFVSDILELAKNIKAVSPNPRTVILPCLIIKFNFITGPICRFGCLHRTFEGSRMALCRLCFWHHPRRRRDDRGFVGGGFGDERASASG